MTSRYRILVIAGGALAVIVLIWLFWPKGNSEAETRDVLDYLIAAETEAQWPGLDVETAAANLQTPEAAAEFLRTGVVLQDYAARHVSPDDVLVTRGANGEDQAALLSALVQAQGFETRLRTADWPAGDVPRIIASPARERPAHEALMAYLEVDVETGRQDAAREAEARVARLRDNTANAFIAANAYGPLSGPVSLTRPDRRVIVEYRDGEAWIALDPVLETAPEQLQPYDLPELSSVEVRLELVTAQGERRVLGAMAMQGAGEATLSFVPASGLNDFYDGPPDPTGVPLWLPILQQSETGVAGEAFTPAGRSAPRFDAEPQAVAPPQVSEIAITNVDVSSVPEVVLTLTSDAPADTVWRAGHFNLSDGDRVSPVRVEALPSQPREISFVTDVSPSMVENGRIFSAGLLGQDIIRQLAWNRSFASLSVAGDIQAVRTMTNVVQPWAGINDYDEGLTIRPGDNLIEGVRFGLSRFWQPGDVIVLTDGDITDEDLRALGEITTSTTGRHRIIAVVPEAQVVRFAPFVHRVFVLPASEADVSATAQAVYNSTGSNLRISFVAEPGDGEAARTLTLAVRDRDVSTSADYVPPPHSDAAGRLEVSLWRDGEPLGEARTLVELGQPDTAWRLMSRHKILVSGGRFDAEAFMRRFYADERFTYQLALDDEAAELPVGPNLSMLSAAQSVTGYTEQALGTALTGGGLQVVLFSASPEMGPDDALYFNRTLDLLSDGGLSRAGGARAALALAEAEAEFLGVESLSAAVMSESVPAVIDPRTAIPDGWPSAAVRQLADGASTLVATQDGRAGWLISPDGVLSARLFTPAAKGANARRAAAEFQPLIKAMSITGTVASGLGSPYGVQGWEIGALFGILDFDMRMYCYSSVMMGFVADAIEAGDYGTEDWEAYASEQCGIDPANAMSAFVGGVAKGAAYGWAGDQVTNIAKGPTGDALTHWQEVGVNTGAGFILPFLGDTAVTSVALANRRPDAVSSQVVGLAAAPVSADGSE